MVDLYSYRSTYGGVFSVLTSVFFHHYMTRTTEEIKTDFAKHMSAFQTTLAWKTASVSELLAPVCMQLSRSKRAFDRWKDRNLFLEAKIIKASNETIRDLLLAKGHLIPPSLLEDAGKLVEHYDRWLEEFDRQRSEIHPDLGTPFVFVGHKGYPFPIESEKQFHKAFRDLWLELYGSNPTKAD